MFCRFRIDLEGDLVVFQKEIDHTAAAGKTLHIPHKQHRRRVEGGYDVPETLVRRRFSGGLRNFFGVYQAIQEAGLTVPGDVSVVSFDDAPLAPGAGLRDRHAAKSGSDATSARVKRRRRDTRSAYQGGRDSYPCSPGGSALLRLAR